MLAVQTGGSDLLKRIPKEVCEWPKIGSRLFLIGRCFQCAAAGGRRGHLIEQQKVVAASTVSIQVDRVGLVPFLKTGPGNCSGKYGERTREGVPMEIDRPLDRGLFEDSFCICP